MLTPEYLYRITEGAEDIASQLHKNIIDKIIARMMARIGRGEDYLLTATDKWQIEVLQEAGYLLEDIQKELSDKTKKQVQEIKEAMEEAGVTALQWDDKIYQAAGLSPVPLLQSPALMRIMQRNFNATSGEWKNFTRTTASEAQRLFINQMDNAYNMVVSGAVSYTEAVRDVLKEVSETGLKVNYPSGYKMSIESATMMILRTGISQAAGDVTMTRMEEMDWDIVLVSAHMGARTGDGGQNPGNHLWWQGQFYSRTGRTKEYPGFKRSTGYGTGEGLCGWNCRHSFGPGDGVNNPFADKDIAYADNYKIEKMQQRQRTLERRVRDTKRKIQNMQTTIDNCRDEKLKFELQQDFDRKSYLLKKQNAAYKQYCEENNLKPYNERLQVAKWNREQAMKAAGAARRYESAKK